MEYTVNELHELFDTLDLIEELSQEYEYFDNNQLNHRADVLRFEFMDKNMKSQNSKMIYQYFIEHLDELKPYEKKKLQQVSDYFLKNKYAQKYFGETFNNLQNELKEKWSEYLTPKLFEFSFEKDLDNIRLFYSDYYAEKFHLHSPNYKEILTYLYGKDFVCSCCRQLNNYQKKIIQFYKNTILSKNIPTSAEVCDLMLTQQQASDFFNFFLNQVSDLAKTYTITAEFHQKAKVIKNNHKIYIYLSSYHSFSISLFEFLELFGEAYSKIFNKTDSSTSEENLNYKKQAFSYYAALLPIVSIDIAKIISDFFVNIGTPREVSNVIFKNFLAIRRNPVSLYNINMIQIFLIDLIAAELEEKWFDGEITSRELLIQWEELMDEYFVKVSFNKFEISIKIFHLLLEGLGFPLLRIGILLSLFEHGMLNEHYNHPLQSLLNHFRNHSLGQWIPDELFLTPHTVKEEAVQYLLFHLSQLYHHVYS